GFGLGAGRTGAKGGRFHRAVLSQPASFGSALVKSGLGKIRMTSLQGKRVLVTGATGFIGGRLIERLILEQGAEVVALVHQFRNASRLARFPLSMVGGDVTEAAVVKKAAEGCDAIVHCAVTFVGTA